MKHSIRILISYISAARLQVQQESLPHAVKYHRNKIRFDDSGVEDLPIRT